MTVSKANKSLSAISNSISNLLGGDFGSKHISLLNDNLSSKLSNQVTLNNGIHQQLLSKADSLISPEKIKDLWSNSYWSSEKVELYDQLRDSGELEFYNVNKTSPYHMGNFGIRERGIVFRYTQEELDELKKCKESVVYFAKTYCKIKNEKGVYGNIEHLRDYQINMLNQLSKDENRFNIIMASRQTGKSVTTSIYILWYVLFNKDKNILVMSNKQESANEYLDKIKNIYEGLPYFLKPGVMIWNITSIRFDNKCRIFCHATTQTAAIGFAIDLLVADEFAHIPANLIESFWRSVFPTISSMDNSRVILISTPNGRNLFWRLYNGALLKENQFKPFRVDWWEVKGRDEKWKEEIVAMLGSETAFNQEYGLQFIVDTNMLVTRDTVKFFKKVNVPFVDSTSKPEFGFLDDNIKEHLFWHPKYDVNNLFSDFLLLSVDFAEGAGRDYNIISFLKVNIGTERNVERMIEGGVTEIKDLLRLEQIGLYKNNDISINDFAKVIATLIFELCNLNNIRVILEVNDNRYLQCLNELAKRSNFDSGILVKTKHSASGISEQKSQKRKIGIRLNSKNKPMLFNELRQRLHEHKLIVSDKDSIDQLESFGIGKNGRYVASSINDDIAMSLTNSMIVFLERGLDSFFEFFIEKNKGIPYLNMLMKRINDNIHKWEMNEYKETKKNELTRLKI